MNTGYYTALATHSRHGLDRPGHAFVGELALTRVGLPADRASAAPVATRRGAVTPEDRLMISVDDVVAFCDAHDAPRPYRVEYLSPPRRNGHRFAAMSVYLLYVDPTYAGPTHFVLEAGMATGEAKICYPPCEVGAWQTVRAGYRPTPFSTKQQVFRGTFDVDPEAPDEPGRLVVEVYRTEEATTPCMRISVTYAHDAEAIRGPHPLWSRLVAGARIGAIADAVHAPIAYVLRLALRALGQLLPWIEPPRARPELPAATPGRLSLPS